MHRVRQELQFRTRSSVTYPTQRSYRSCRPHIFADLMASTLTFVNMNSHPFLVHSFSSFHGICIANLSGSFNATLADTARELELDLDIFKGRVPFQPRHFT